MSKQNLPRRQVIFEGTDKNYHGTYTVDGQYLTVFFGMATKTTIIDPLNGNPEASAKLLLSELVSEKN